MRGVIEDVMQGSGAHHAAVRVSGCRHQGQPEGHRPAAVQGLLGALPGVPPAAAGQAPAHSLQVGPRARPLHVLYPPLPPP